MDAIWTKHYRDIRERKAKQYRLNRIEIHAADHCVQKCHGCSHAADIAPKQLYTPSDYEPHFQNMEANGITWRSIDILGGEPFINKDLPALIRMCKKYTNTVGVMSNLYWLKDQKAIEEQEEALSSMTRLIYTLYYPLLKKHAHPGGNGFPKARKLIKIIQERHPKLILTQFGHRPVTQFADIQFHHDPRPIKATKCNFRGCKQLLHTGTVYGCCAARRVPDWDEIDKYDITGEFNSTEFKQWYNRPILDLCKHCSIATEGITHIPWRLTDESPTAPTPQDSDAQDRTQKTAQSPDSSDHSHGQ